MSESIDKAGQEVSSAKDAGLQLSMSAQQLSVFHFLGSVERGGAESRLLDLICRDPSLSNVKHVIYLLGQGDPALQALFADFTDAGCEIVPIGRNPMKVAKAMSVADGSVIFHSHVLLASAWILAIGAMVRPNSIRLGHIRSTGDGKPKSAIRTIYAALMRRLLRRSAHHIFGVSESALESSLGPDWRQWGKASVAYNCITMPAAHSRDDRAGCKTLSVVGRIGPEKNQTHAINVARLLVDRGLPIRLQIFGRGATTELQHQIGTDETWVSFEGEVPMPDILAVTDLLIAPSTREGLPGVVLEASSAGVPVVGSAIGPMLEVAHYLPIKLVSLQAPLSEWADAVEGSLEQSRHSIREAYAESPFALDNGSRAIWNAWNGLLPE